MGCAECARASRISVESVMQWCQANLFSSAIDHRLLFLLSYFIVLLLLLLSKMHSRKPISRELLVRIATALSKFINSVIIIILFLFYIVRWTMRNAAERVRSFHREWTVLGSRADFFVPRMQCVPSSGQVRIILWRRTFMRPIIFSLSSSWWWNQSNQKRVIYFAMMRRRYRQHHYSLWFSVHIAGISDTLTTRNAFELAVRPPRHTESPCKKLTWPN